MSHVFEALRKAEGHATDGELLPPDLFFQTIESTPDLTSVASESATVRPESHLVVWNDPHTLAADRYRLLRMHLEKLQSGRKLRTLLLTSPAPQDGKSTVALNLATILADQGKHKVLLLEADLRCPSLRRRLGLERWLGLSDCLAHDADPMSALRRIEPFGFYLLPAGEPASNPTELLQSERFTQLIHSMSSRFDWILIDSTPASPIADTLASKKQADACLLVVRAGKTPREGVEDAIRQLGPGFVMGIILNGLESLEKDYSAYYSRYYGEAQSSTRETPAKPAR